MVKSDNGKKFALIAAICYAVYGAYSIIDEIIRVVQHPNWHSITVSNVIFWIAMLIMAVALFMKNEKAVIIAVGVNVLLNAYYVIAYFSLWNLLGFLSYATLVVILILSLKGNAVVKKIWFISAAAMLLGCLIGWISYDCFTYISALWISMLFSIVEIIAIVFVGLWLKGNVAPEQNAPVNEYATFNPQAVYSAPATTTTIGGADKLKMYKDLLDSGAITQEEFEAKKKQILGL